MATYRSWALRVVSPRNPSLSSSTRWQNRSSATACNCRKIFQSDSLISRIIALTNEPGRQLSPNAGIAESQKRTPSSVSKTYDGGKTAVFSLWKTVGVARHLVVEGWRLCFRTLRQPPATIWRKRNAMQTLLQDMRYGARMLMNKLGFTLIAVITLCLGIGANTAIFTIVNAVLLRPLPYPQSERLMEVGRAYPGDEGVNSLSEPKFVFLRDNCQSFEAITGIQEMGPNFQLSGESQAEYISGLYVTADFLRVLGAP